MTVETDHDLLIELRAMVKNLNEKVDAITEGKGIGVIVELEGRVSRLEGDREIMHKRIDKYKGWLIGAFTTIAGLVTSVGGYLVIKLIELPKGE